ncbi:MAG: hypothetical protein OEZ09_16030 [Betaproteobacteria bacterium]|nr:hypothetical protein [Betaproteobacteria bacterium]
MKQLIRALGDSIVGVTSGFDRIVFQGMIRPLMYPDGAMSFFRRRGILFKDAKNWMLRQTARLASAVEEWSLKQCGEPTTYLWSSAIRKDEEARRRQQEKGIPVGLVGTWSCVEAGSSYRLEPGEGGPRLRYVHTRCKHLYSYLDHPDYGFMNIRMQTWFPYRIQIAMNGREWLVRQLQQAGIGFERQGNKILRVDDLDAMQGLLEQQLRTNWCSMLDAFVPLAFPTISSALGHRLRYTWTLWQSEWASDLLFRDRRKLDQIIESVIRHAFIGAHPGRLLRYFGRPVRKDGRPRRDLRDPLKTTILDLDEGCRIRHWLGHNSVKLYNEGNVLRIETTVNHPGAFRVHRRKQGARKDAPKERLPLRKGVADTTLRARVCQEINDRFSDHVATMRSTQRFESILTPFTRRQRRRGRGVRALDPTGKDLALLRAIADPRFTVGGFCNKDLRQLLVEDPRHVGKTEKQRSGMVTRALRLLRDHSVIRRLPKSRRYQVTLTGRSLVMTLQAALAASTEELTRIAA